MIRIRPFLGSLVDPRLHAHAIVNASNPHAALGSGVSAAIRGACGGSDYQAEVRRAWEDEFDEPLAASDCLVTGAGRATSFRWVLHVPAVDYRVRDPETGGSSGPSRIRACTRSALTEAARLADGVDRFVVGFPLLGAGHGGLGPVASASAMMEAIASADTTALEEIRFAVLTPALVSLVQNAATRFGLVVADAC